MTTHKVSFSGNQIRKKHTHYEVYPYVRSSQATVIIRGDIFYDFKEKYGKPITEYERLEAEVDLHRNDERVQECQDPYKSPFHLMGSISSIGDLVVCE